jgi:hypothetical protein
MLQEPAVACPSSPITAADVAVSDWWIGGYLLHLMSVPILIHL